MKKTKLKQTALPRLMLFVCFILVKLCPLYSQTNPIISLEECYALAEKNYPLAKINDLIERSKDYTVQNLTAAILPQINLAGQATYQSDVTKISIPGITIPSITKDQYKLYGEVTQTLTDFALNKQQNYVTSLTSRKSHL